jgi:hypothetical protein
MSSGKCFISILFFGIQSFILSIGKGRKANGEGQKVFERAEINFGTCLPRSSQRTQRVRELFIIFFRHLSALHALGGK